MSAPAKPYLGHTGSDVAATGLHLAAVAAAAAGLLALARAMWTAGATLPVTLAEDIRSTALAQLPAVSPRPASPRPSN